MDVVADLVEQHIREHEIPHKREFEQPRGKPVTDPVDEELDPWWLALPGTVIQATRIANRDPLRISRPSERKGSGSRDRSAGLLDGTAAGTCHSGQTLFDVERFR